MEEVDGETDWKEDQSTRIDHAGEYKDRFLRFGENNGIGIHFLVGKYGMAKEMKHFLLEKVRYFLSNAQ